jgi:hypothetical protein
MNAVLKPWKEQGGPLCRAAWESGTRHDLHLIGSSIELHARLYQCNACSVFREELERYAHEVSPQEALAIEQTRSFVPGTD